MQKFGQVKVDSNSDILCAWYKYVTLIFSKPQAEARRIRRALSKATRQAAILLKNQLAFFALVLLLVLVVLVLLIVVKKFGIASPL